MGYIKDINAKDIIDNIRYIEDVKDVKVDDIIGDIRIYLRYKFGRRFILLI